MRKIDIACIIDDDPIYVFSMKKLMTMAQFSKNIMVFQNGAEALRYLAPVISSTDQLPDMILVDINMPVMDGWQFLDEFVKIKPFLKKRVTIYIVSSSILDEDMERAKNYSALSGYVVKPVTEQDLLRLLSQEPD